MVSNSERAVRVDPRQAALGAIACLQQLSELFQRRRAQLAAEVGLTEHQWAVLEETTYEHFMPSMFARSRHSTAAAVSKTLRQLIDKGLVSVRIAAEDGRQRRYELTHRGKQVMEQLRRRREDAIQDVWLRLELADLRAFTEIGTELTELLEQYAQRANKEK